jgi:hypothetical protein
MKTTILKFSAFVLIIVLMGAGCRKEKKYEDIPLEYIKCPCNNNDTILRWKIAEQDILLFDASKTSGDEMLRLSFHGEKPRKESVFINYHKDTKSAKLCYIGVESIICIICNLPSTLNTLEIPLTGERVSLTADEFKVCPPMESGNNTTINCVLTSFKRRIK